LKNSTKDPDENVNVNSAKRKPKLVVLGQAEQSDDVSMTNAAHGGRRWPPAVHRGVQRHFFHGAGDSGEVTGEHGAVRPPRPSQSFDAAAQANRRRRRRFFSNRRRHSASSSPFHVVPFEKKT